MGNKWSPGYDSKGKATKLYKVWSTMKDRCKNPNSKRYKYYGAMGVRVCREWIEFIKFHGWAMANGYKEGLSIDRIDNNGNYNPGNCRWIPLGAQTLNHRVRKGQGVNWDKRRNRWRGRVTLDGREICKYSKQYQDALSFVEANREILFSRKLNLILKEAT